MNQFRNSMEQLSVAEGKLGNVMTRLLGVDIFNKKLEMDEERWSRNQLSRCPLCPSGLSLRDLATRRISLKKSPKRRKMTSTAAPRRRRWRTVMPFPPQSPFPPGAHTGIPEAPVEPDSWCQESKQARREEALGFLNRPRRPINEPDIIWYPLASMTRCQNCQVSKNILSPCCPVSCHCQGHGLFGAIHAIL